MIKVDDEFSMERDAFGWIVHQTITNTPGPRVKNETRVKPSYHANIVQCCQHMIDVKCGKAHTLAEVIETVKEFGKVCSLAVKGVR